MTPILHMLAVAWAFGLEHRTAIITILTTVAVALVNRHVGGAALQTFLQVLLDVVSPSTQQGQLARIVGTRKTFATPFKVPLLMRSQPTLTLGTTAPQPAKKHSVIGTMVLIAFGVVIALAFGGCCKNPDTIGCHVQTGLEQCAAPAVSQEVDGIAPVVQTILTQGGTAWQDELKGMEIAIGAKLVICAVGAIVAALTAKMPDPALKAQVDPAISMGVFRGTSYLESKNVTPPARAKVMLHAYGLQ